MKRVGKGGQGRSVKGGQRRSVRQRRDKGGQGRSVKQGRAEPERAGVRKECGTWPTVLTCSAGQGGTRIKLPGKAGRPRYRAK